MEINELERIARNVRRRLIRMIYEAKGGHIGGSLSATDILTALYFELMHVDPRNVHRPDRDRFILSKGHSVEAYYCTLAERGFFPEELLNTYGKFRSPLAGHPTVKVPGVELNSGALGHGLSVGVGMALAARMNRLNYRTFVLMGDGEQGEGSVYEAAMAASHYKLDHLCAIIDRNGLQISGSTEEVMGLNCLIDRWTALGWKVTECNGNDMGSLLLAFKKMEEEKGRPGLLIAHTVKGKGVSFMENKASWHHHVPDDRQFEQAMQELTINGSM